MALRNFLWGMGMIGCLPQVYAIDALRFSVGTATLALGGTNTATGERMLFRSDASQAWKEVDSNTSQSPLFANFGGATISYCEGANSGIPGDTDFSCEFIGRDAGGDETSVTFKAFSDVSMYGLGSITGDYCGGTI
ncbi:uncharacterized protein N7458_006749 [Penicillium daleae]|uniref:Uncharacterized protein n=1 Tax=Penicillium daleae TaxID=63821 RepID=A0AAD6C5B4_9EURO|nr:uncharacterized protein N7458_006749 [Penicillium daleae]KAJ5450300.1 hypothetical protein N7458_006749 [Penicillium daleae]